MIKTVTVTNHKGESLVIELTRPELSGFYVKGITGLGAADADINVTSMATADGGSFNSARVGTRNIVLTLGFLELPTVEYIRHQCYRFFPIKKKIRLTFETDLRTSWIDGYVESNDPDIFSDNEIAQISVICPDPYFRDVNGTTTQFFGTFNRFEFPFEKKLDDDTSFIMGNINLKQYSTIYYQGDADTGIIISIYAFGPVENITIYNIDTREKMRINHDKLSSLVKGGIMSGDSITICTEKGKKSITLLRNGVITNILNCLDKDADWIAVTQGDNIMSFTADVGTENVQLEVTNDILYEGV